ncbi:hypothetical protein CRG98_040929 [Punica granatum]|uniref:Uncharacterized protein n=1 Tax=Punica granatum TaxID=22663 RepID=A0A2I0I3Z8_PUNGR|nr:hypothetical protein CRG98_040929 [Punica granatum]
MELFFHGTLSTPMLEIFQISGKAIFLHDHNLNAAMLERSQATGGQLKRQSEVEQHHGALLINKQELCSLDGIPLSENKQRWIDQCNGFVRRSASNLSRSEVQRKGMKLILYQVMSKSN